jgi:hypothetical protein
MNGMRLGNKINNKGQKDMSLTPVPVPVHLLL